MEFNPSGLTVRTFEEILAEKVAQYQAIYGNDINIAQNTPDGQRIGLEANALLDLELFAQWLYGNMDVDNASGQALNSLAKISGLTRKPASRSFATVEITTDRALTILENWEAKDDFNRIWYSKNEINLNTGTTAITLHSKTWGAIVAGIGEINAQNHIILGITNINNPTPATIGSDEESDADLRKRRNASVANPAFSTIGELYSGLANLAGVTDLKIYENSTSSLDTELNLNPHSLWVIIDGGVIADIAEIMAISKTAGCGLKGNIIGEYVEQVSPSISYTHQMRFDRSINKNFEVAFTVQSTNGGLDIAIFDALKDIIFDIGNDVNITSLYAFIYALRDDIFISNLVAKNGGNDYTSIAPVEPFERFKIDTLTITEVV
jgi:hypothetical protein